MAKKYWDLPVSIMNYGDYYKRLYPKESKILRISYESCTLLGVNYSYFCKKKLMDFRKAAENRYTTKKYDSTRKISKAHIEDLKHILALSPSSINSQPWMFTFISNEETKNALADASFFNGPKIKDASHLVVFSVMDNLERFGRHVEENLAEGSVNYYKQFIQDQPAEVTINWLSQQVYISLGFFLAACAAMEIDSTPMEGIEPEKYKKILKIADQKVLFAVSIGYRDPEDANQPNVKGKSRLNLEKVVTVIE